MCEIGSEPGAGKATVRLVRFSSHCLDLFHCF